MMLHSYIMMETYNNTLKTKQMKPHQNPQQALPKGLYQIGNSSIQPDTDNMNESYGMLNVNAYRQTLFTPQPNRNKFHQFPPIWLDLLAALVCTIAILSLVCALVATVLSLLGIPLDATI